MKTWLCFGGPASDSGFYLKLVTRVYLIEKARFRWYCLSGFLEIQVAKRAFIVPVRKGLTNAVKHARAGPVLIRVGRENRVPFCLIRDESAGFNCSRVRAAHGWER